MADTEESPEVIKERGNASVKDGKFEEAVLHYTHAAKLDPDSHAIYSNRSFAFLKLAQYSLAMEDATETIRLNPTWPKGYYRKAEIEFATTHYADAIVSYETALKLKPDDANIRSAIDRTRRARMDEIRSDEQIPWVGCGVGIVIGVIIVIADYIFTSSPTHPLIMASITIAIGIFGYIIAKVIRSHLKNQRKALIHPNKFFDDDVEDEDSSEASKNGTRTSPRYTKSQARQRFKKGKM